MISDGLILALIVIGCITVAAWVGRSIVYMIMSSIGMICASLMIYQQTGELLPAVLLFALSFIQIAVLDARSSRA